MKKETNIWHDGPEAEAATRDVAQRFNDWFDHLFDLDEDLPTEDEERAPDTKLFSARTIVC